MQCYEWGICYRLDVSFDCYVEDKSSPSGKSPLKSNGAGFNGIITSNVSSGGKSKSAQLIAGGIEILEALLADISSDFLTVVRIPCTK